MLKRMDEVQPDYLFLLGMRVGVPKKWWHGIEGVWHIFMGPWHDSYVGYEGYAINEVDAAAPFWDEYQEAHPDDTDGRGFGRYMLDSADAVRGWLSDIIASAMEVAETESAAA